MAEEIVLRRFVDYPYSDGVFKKKRPSWNGVDTKNIRCYANLSTHLNDYLQDDILLDKPIIISIIDNIQTCLEKLKNDLNKQR